MLYGGLTTLGTEIMFRERTNLSDVPRDVHDLHEPQGVSLPRYSLHSSSFELL